MSDEYAVINGVRYRREGSRQQSYEQNPNSVRMIGDLLQEAVTTAPKGRSLISTVPEGPMTRPMDPFQTSCNVCQHLLIESNCPDHKGMDYLFFNGFDNLPRGHYHRKCLDGAVAERTRRIQESLQEEQ